MDTQFQDLQWIIDRTKKEFKREPNRRISALFRDLRSNKKYALFGDYSILWAIGEAMRQLSLPLVRTHFATACRYSNEYKSVSRKEKMWWLNNLTSGDLK